MPSSFSVAPTSSFSASSSLGCDIFTSSTFFPHHFIRLHCLLPNCLHHLDLSLSQQKRRVAIHDAVKQQNRRIRGEWRRRSFEVLSEERRKGNKYDDSKCEKERAIYRASRWIGVGRALWPFANGIKVVVWVVIIVIVIYYDLKYFFTILLVDNVKLFYTIR